MKKSYFAERWRSDLTWCLLTSMTLVLQYIIWSSRVCLLVHCTAELTKHSYLTTAWP